MSDNIARQETRYEGVMRRLPSDAERAVLVSLPYRIGLYVSHADTTGGWAAQEREMIRLNEILRAYAEDYCKSEFVQDLLMQTIAGRDSWVRWSHRLETLPEECVAALYDLRGVLTDKEIIAFCEIMLEIAENVALAFREIQADPLPRPSFLARLLGRKDPGRYTHANISPTEREALETLADALDLAA